MDHSAQTRCTAFAGFQRIASGELAHVALKTREVLDRGEQAPILIFEDATSQQIGIDFRGTAEDVLARLPAAAGEAAPAESPRGPGRPKLGVVAREVTLLPRHWDWLNEQPGGASVALRKLVEEARRANAGKDRIRRSRDSAYRFMSALAGDLPGFEEATRALFAGHRAHFEEIIGDWPEDVRSHLLGLSAECLENEAVAGG